MYVGIDDEYFLKQWNVVAVPGKTVQLRPVGLEEYIPEIHGELRSMSLFVCTDVVFSNYKGRAGGSSGKFRFRFRIMSPVFHRFIATQFYFTTLM
jgi:hypothetical protein